MKKKIFVLVLLIGMVSLFGDPVVKLKTTKYKIQDRQSASISMTSIYESEFWAEFYLLYEENNNSFDEAGAEKIIYEFISNYKVEHKFSTVEVEIIQEKKVGKSTTSLLKRVIFRQIRK